MVNLGFPQLLSELAFIAHRVDFPNQWDSSRFVEKTLSTDTVQFWCQFGVQTFKKFVHICRYFLIIKVAHGYCKKIRGLPWWRSGWESACQCRGHGFEPWSGKIPHATEQLGPWATTTEPAHLEPVLRNKRGHDSERPAHRDEEWPLLATTRGSPRTEMKTQHSQK